jgi:trehalose 6-phosphate phosphatase
LTAAPAPGAGARLPADFRARLAAAPARRLILDYDGTLAPFHPDRDEARPLPGIARSLREIAKLPGTAVSIVSGRPSRELERLLFDGAAPDAIELFGEHGWERRTAGALHVEPLPPETELALAACVRAAEERGWGERLERKRTAVVLHTRGLPRERAEPIERECERAWTAAGAGGALRVDRIDGGVEARCAARDKGDAVREIAARAGEGALVVYVGDDLTDEDAFRALGASGVGLRVGRDAAGEKSRRTAAIGGFDSCEDVAGWLASWPEVLEPAPQPPYPR